MKTKNNNNNRSLQYEIDTFSEDKSIEVNQIKYDPKTLANLLKKILNTYRKCIIWKKNGIIRFKNFKHGDKDNVAKPQKIELI